MRHLLIPVIAGVLAVASQVAVAEDEPVRNPFWPQDYEGTRYPITVTPRIKLQPKEEMLSARARLAKKVLALSPEAAAAKATQLAVAKAKAKEDQLWKDARATLKFGAQLHFADAKRSGSAITINDRAYGVGDLISTNLGDERFTWSVEAISTEGKITLKRRQHKPLRKNESK